MATEEHTPETSHGINVGSHLEFIDWMASNPDDAAVTFSATGTSEDVINRTTATISEWELGGERMGEDRAHPIRFGLPPEIEEAMGYTELEDRQESIEVALAALTACINGTIGYNAVREGLDFDEVETRVSVPVDLRVLFGIHDVDRADEMYGDIHLEVTVTAPDLSPEEIKQLSTYPARSPTYNLIMGAQTDEIDLTVNT
ncbi:OsmC family protein [Halohasta litorea]|uniref:OsmC family protein n=1 Tax=Halohasta litorea TaxID=869891 RepID=A0ABD6D7U4_9EURY|nr:OsmC family protein [Halohasta litorea]